MALADIIIPKKTITVGESSFTVRALCADDVTRALYDAQSEVEQAVDLYKEVVNNPSDDAQMNQFTASLLRTAPTLVARVIAYAADEPDQSAIVARLPLPVQTEAFYAVIELTLVEPDSLKKFVGNITSIISKVNPTK